MSAVVIITAAFTCLAIIGGGAWKLISAIWSLVTEVRACTAALENLTHKITDADSQIHDHEQRIRKLETKT